MTRDPEERPTDSVPEGTTQGGETPEQPTKQNRWTWVEPSIWTARMLTALEHGVKGGRWYSLIDKVYRRSTLKASFKKVEENKGAPGTDRVTVEQYARKEEEELDRLERSLREDTYRPQYIRRAYINKTGSIEKRPLGIPTVRDRVVQGALRHALEPIFEYEFAEHSYGFRPGRGCKDALRRVDHLLKAGRTWVVDADITKYFDTIPHDRLMERIEEKVADGRVLNLITAFLTQGILDEVKEYVPDEGTPQGAVLSPLLSNIYLDPLDHLMEQKGHEMVRYADDFVVLCATQEEAEQALELIRTWMADAGLQLHPTKTHIVDATQKGGFDFLGYHFERAYRWPRKKSLAKLKDTIRVRTRRCNGHSMPQIITDINKVLRGWFEYFKHSYKTTFPPLDSWIRMRLRSILRKRHKGKGRGRGNDHQRWPNAYFANLGLFSLTTAHAAACQSYRR